MIHLSFLLFSLLFAVGLIAGLFDTLVGGGGLIALPAILLTGLPPALALGTNKLQSTVGSGSATLRLFTKGGNALKHTWPGILSSMLGAIIGATIVLHAHPASLAKWIPPLLVCVLLYAIFSKRIRSQQEHTAYIPYSLFMIFAGLILGAYDAFLGPGTGVFWAASLVAIMGFSLRKATIYTKLFNFISNLVALCIFIFAHQVVYTIGFSMAAGQFIGGQIGAHLILKEGHRIIRPLYIIIVTLILLSLSYKTYF